MPDYRAIAVQAARRNGVDPHIFVRQIQQESGFRADARSGAGAVGIAQIVPRWHPGVDATDPVASLNYAARWMGQLVRKYGNYREALSVYNSGNPTAYKDPGFAGGQTFNYVKTILGAGGNTGPPSPVRSSAPLSPALSPSPAPPTLPRNDGVRQLLNEGLSSVNAQLGLPTFKLPMPRALPAPSATTSPAPGSTTLPGLSGIAKTALTQLGTPYQWGGPAKLGSRTDCSGLLQASAAANGVKIGRTTYEQWKQGSPVSLNHLMPGDAVFFHPGPKGPEHVAIYIGNGRVVEDPHTGAVVSISRLAGRGPIGARRY